ncbi:MAG: hypothetical protein ACI91J_003888, partial [Yoonia sp.]
MNQFRLIILLSLIGISGIAADKKAKAPAELKPAIING